MPIIELHPSSLSRLKRISHSQHSSRRRGRSKRLSSRENTLKKRVVSIRDVLGIGTGRSDRNSWISRFVDEAEGGRGKVLGTGDEDECPGLKDLFYHL